MRTLVTLSLKLALFEFVFLYGLACAPSGNNTESQKQEDSNVIHVVSAESSNILPSLDSLVSFNNELARTFRGKSSLCTLKNNSLFNCDTTWNVEMPLYNFKRVEEGLFQLYIGDDKIVEGVTTSRLDMEMLELTRWVDDESADLYYFYLGMGVVYTNLKDPNTTNIFRANSYELVR